MAKQKTETVEVNETKFTKTQIIKSETFANVKDILIVVLSDESTYTIKEVKDLITKFKEREVR